MLADGVEPWGHKNGGLMIVCISQIHIGPCLERCKFDLMKVFAIAVSGGELHYNRRWTVRKSSYGCYGDWNHQQTDCLFNSLLRLSTGKPRKIMIAFPLHDVIVPSNELTMMYHRSNNHTAIYPERISESKYMIIVIKRYGAISIENNWNFAHIPINYYIMPLLHHTLRPYRIPVC